MTTGPLRTRRGCGRPGPPRAADSGLGAVRDAWRDSGHADPCRQEIAHHRTQPFHPGWANRPGRLMRQTAEAGITAVQFAPRWDYTTSPRSGATARDRLTWIKRDWTDCR